MSSITFPTARLAFVLMPVGTFAASMKLFKRLHLTALLAVFCFHAVMVKQHELESILKVAVAGEYEHRSDLLFHSGGLFLESSCGSPESPISDHAASSPLIV